MTLQPGKDPFDELMHWVFIVQSVVLLIAIIILQTVSWSKARRWDSDQMSGASIYGARPGMWAVMALATTFMMMPFSFHVSRLIPNIEVL